MISQIELLQIRTAINATPAEFAGLLGVSVAELGEYERGAVIPEPVQRVAKGLQMGTRTGGMDELLPQFVIGEDMRGEIEHEVIMHTRYPRFIAVVTEDAVQAVDSIGDGIERINILMWLDEPLGDISGLLNQAMQAFIDYTDESL